MPIIAHQNQIIGQAENPQTIVRDTVGWTGKNLYKTENMLGSANVGITTTKVVGVVTLNGTTTDEYIFPTEPAGQDYYDIEAGKSYIFSTETEYADIELQVYVKETSSSSWTRLAQDTTSGNELSFTVPNSFYDIWVRCLVRSGKTLTNVTIYPMLRHADIMDGTFEPHHKTVEEELEDLGSGGHTIQNTSGTAVEQRDNMQFKDMSVSDDSTNNRTIVRQTQVVATRAEWESMTPDPNITYYLPWMTSADYAEDRTPIGTIIQVTGNYDNTTTPQKSWYPHLPDSEDYLLCTGTQPRVDEYPELANYFTEVYGSVHYFNDNVPIGRFAVPDFRTDFPTNGMLAIKAKTTSTKITYAEVNDDRITANNVWSAEKVDSVINAVSVPSGITGVYLYKIANIYLFYITDVSATNGVIGTLAVHPNRIISAPAYPQGVSYNCRIRIGTDGAMTVVPTNQSDPAVTSQNVLAMGFFIK